MKELLKEAEDASNEELGPILEALQMYLKGDIETHIPTNVAGTMGEIVEIVNTLFANSKKASSEIVSVLESVGNRGQLVQPMEKSPLPGPTRDIMEAFNQVLDELNRSMKSLK